MNLKRTRVLAAAGVVTLALLITGQTNAPVRTRRNMSQFDHLDKERLDSLLEILRTRPPSLPVPPEIEQSKDRKIRGEYFAARRRVFEEHDARISAAVEELAGDNGPNLIAERVGAIVDSIRTVEDMPMANDRFQSDAVGTFADHTYSSLIEALTKMPDATPFLLDARERVNGRP